MVPTIRPSPKNFFGTRQFSDFSKLAVLAEKRLVKSVEREGDLPPHSALRSLAWEEVTRRRFEAFCAVPPWIAHFTMEGSISLVGKLGLKKKCSELLGKLR